MRKIRRNIRGVVFSSLVLAGVAFISFNLSTYSSWILTVVISSFILTFTVLIYRLVELRPDLHNKPTIFESAGMAEVLAVDQHFQRGKVYQLQGKSNKAIKEFKRILSINPEDSDVCYQLGKIYQEKGRKKEAVDFLERYLKLDQEKKWKEEVEAILPALRGATVKGNRLK